MNGKRIYIMQIVNGIEVNSEAYFPKLQEYCPSAEGTRAIFLQLRETTYSDSYGRRLRVCTMSTVGSP